VTRTRLLVALLILVVLLELFPGHAALIKLIAVCAGGLYFATSLGARYLAQRRRDADRAAQEAADAAEYQRYRSALDAIQARHDPLRDLSDPTSISPEYRDELSALHDKHQDMLNRKFGPRS
jgi:hypothetical protein